MARKRIIITKADYEHLYDLIRNSVSDAFRDKPYLKNLQGELDVAQIVGPESIPCDLITMNSTFRLRDMKTKEAETLTLAYPDEANIVEGKISVLAPLGTAVLGHSVDDLVRWQVPSGVGRWRVEELLFQPERDTISA